MSLEIKVPSVGESITEVMIVKWLKGEGESVEMDEPVAEIETDKATLEIPSPGAGILSGIRKRETEWASVGEVVALLEPAAEGAKKAVEKKPSAQAESHPAPASKSRGAEASMEVVALPAARRLLQENQLAASEVEGTGKGGRILKEDVQRALDTAATPKSAAASPAPTAQGNGDHRQRERVPMSPLRRTVAQRLVEAQSTAALLTTFNEVDMTAVIQLRKRYAEAFLAKHEVKLGFMSFFVKASVEALKKFPAVNAQIQGDDIVYHNYFDIGIAVSSTKGLVVPVLRNTEAHSFAEIEKKIQDFGARGKENKIELKELEGGTFTISNGGIFGSLLSTPIVNPPQSGVLGLHAINDRPVAIDGAVAIRPMMYLALTYDHRIVDGREAVSFLRTLKELVEDPSRILLEI